MGSHSSKRQSGSDQPQGGRRWLADEPLCLLPLYSNPPQTRVVSHDLHFASDHPTVLLRAGRVDSKRIGEALEVLADAAALIVNLTEQPETIRSIRRIAMQYEVPFIGDPVLYRMALSEYTAAPGLRRLRYRPPDGEGPWTASELCEQGTTIARYVIEEQHLSGVGALLAAGIAISGPSDPRLAALGSLLQGSLGLAMRGERGCRSWLP
jgi:hypothetical protein